MHAVNEILESTLHIGFDEVPWVQNRPGVKNRVLHVRLNDNVIVTQSLYSPGITVSLHRHLAPVFAITQRGAWGHRPTSFDYLPRTYVYEPANVLHQFFNGDEETETTFMLLGGVEFVDPKTKEITSQETIPSILAKYYERCEAQGLPRPNLLR